MSSANPAWLIAQAVKTELDAAFASPTDILEGADFGAYSPQDISVIPPGEEDTRPAPGKTSWINIYVPEDTALVWETGNSYLAKPNIRVRICVEEVKRRGSLHEQVLALAHFVTVALTRSTLDNLARRAPRQTASSTHLQKGATQTWVSEIRLEYEYQGRGAPVDWSKTVPDCDGLTESAASAAITAAGLTPDSDGAFSATVAKGLVINQSPAAGTALYAGDVVTITVSFGTEYTAVPVTAGLTAEAAEAALVAAGLVLGTSTTSMTNDTAAGLVASSSPAAGTGVAAGSAVDIVVSLGDRHYDLPITVFGKCAVRLAFAPSTVFYWVLPNGTEVHGSTTLPSATYTAPAGPAQTVTVRAEAGHTLSEITTLAMGGPLVGLSPVNRINTEDLRYLTGLTSMFIQSAVEIIGEISDLDTVAANITGFMVFEPFSARTGSLRGVLQDLPPLKVGSDSGTYFYATNLCNLTGYLRFIDGAGTRRIYFDNCTNFTGADISQTLVNWNACNASSFARVFRTYFIKRSQLTAAGEAAVVSLLSKGCAFTFAAE